MAPVPFFYFLTLTFISRSNFWNFICLHISRNWWEIKQTLLLPSDRRSSICHRMMQMRMLYVMTLTYISKVTNLVMSISRKRWYLSQKCVKWLLQRFISATDWCHCECVTSWPCPSFARSNIFLLFFKNLSMQRMSPADLRRLVRPRRGIALVIYKVARLHESCWLENWLNCVFTDKDAPPYWKKSWWMCCWRRLHCLSLSYINDINSLWNRYVVSWVQRLAGDRGDPSAKLLCEFTQISDFMYHLFRQRWRGTARCVVGRSSYFAVLLPCQWLHKLKSMWTACGVTKVPGSLVRSLSIQYWQAELLLLCQLWAEPERPHIRLSYWTASGGYDLLSSFDAPDREDLSNQQLHVHAAYPHY